MITHDTLLTSEDLVSILGGRLTSTDLKILQIGLQLLDPILILKKNMPHLEIWGIDGNAELANSARPLLSRVIRARVDGTASLPLPTGFFDCVVIGPGVDKLPAPLAFFTKIKPHLKPGGRLFARVKNVAHASVVLGLLQGEFLFEDVAIARGEAAHNFTASTFRRFLFLAGFGVRSELSVCDSTNGDVKRVLQAAAPLGLDPERVRLAISPSEFLFEAFCAAPPMDNSIGALGPASLRGTSVVVLSYNSLSTIHDCLFSVLSTLGAQDELLVVDNASTDGTRDYLSDLATKYPGVRLFLNETNLGFAAGSNVGIKASRGSCICLLNPDTVVWTGWIERMMARLEDDSVGMVGPISDNIAGAQFVGHYLRDLDGEWPTLEGLAKDIPRAFAGRSAETKLIIGLCLMIRRETLNEVGLLDETMFLGSEDLDLSWRVRARGLRLLVALDVFVHHVGGISFKSSQPEKIRQLLFDSTERLLEKVRNTYGWLPSDEDLWGFRITHQ